MATIVLDEGRVVVVDKPAGITAEAVASALGRRLVHRLDRLTSGLLVLADDARTVQRLQRALGRGEVERQYLLVAHGLVRGGRIESTLVDDRGDGLRGRGPGGKPSITDVEVVDVAADERATLARARLSTGRTHQIRIHLAEAGHPLAGEPVYIRDHRRCGQPELPATRLLLHAVRLAFLHPTTRAPVVVASPPPPDFVAGAAACGIRGVVPAVLAGPGGGGGAQPGR